ncbi:relaxase/mobilization nuclease domain-containing protein [Nostoc sp. FACHB-110]|uniref:relaxase/mobilization nuclease domain-containing protein n=1 Tax=Nostoc sp. FACHB-110 TaxID=2692834 RepID=UPI001686EB8F|nr:relaxase/mobilization nuclease domain-containing protein [Nostoc sp. FACHB-110]MBD2441315.1 relaxase/mobilization nuclease domain-containing protein [Nostoc sp. FACHB-110]
MIGNQTKGRGFRGLLNYLQSQEGAKLIGGNMGGRNPRALAVEFKISRQLNLEADRVVYHASLSLPPNERLDDATWNEIAHRYLEEMGFDSNQYVVYRHSDTQHDHIHICASRIRLDNGKIVHDSWDYKRSESIIRQLERDYALQQTHSSHEKLTRNPSIGQQRRLEREQREYTNGDRPTPQEPPVKQQLQELIDRATADSPTMPQLIERLQIEGVKVRHGLTRNGKSKGISYAMKGQQFSGTNLGAAYTWPGLQKHKGVSYQPQRDDPQITALLLNPAKPIGIEPQTLVNKSPQTDQPTHSLNSRSGAENIQLERTQIVAPILAEILKLTEETQFVGNQHTIYLENQQLILINNSSRKELMRANYIESTSKWEPVEPSHLTPELVQHFQKFIPVIESGLLAAEQEKKATSQHRYPRLRR